jgi:biopolymer transport protein ExbD
VTALRTKGAGRYAAYAEAETTTFRPQLTSLIDVMTFLLVFLIKSFSVQGDVVTPSADLELPVSRSATTPKSITSIEVTKTSVVAEGRAISTLSAADRNDPLLMPDVYKWMKLLGAQASDAAAARKVMIKADREIEFSVLKRVMYSCSKAGFSDFTILAIQKE